MTLHVESIGASSAFYSDILGSETVFEEEGHIFCKKATSGGTSLCIHDETEGASGTLRLLFAVDDVEAFKRRADMRKCKYDVTALDDGVSVVDLQDLMGNLVRLQPRR